MNVKKLLLTTLGLLAMVIVAGCAQPSTPGSSAPQGSSDILQNGTIPPPPQYSAADRTAYAGALELKEPSFCDKVKDENYRKQCKTEIADQAQIEEASVKMDANLCATLSTDDKREACKIGIEVKIAQENQLIQEQETEKKNAELYAKILTGKDYTRCKELSMERFVRDCELNILVNVALEKKDATWCDKASPENREDCKDQFKLAVESQGPAS